MCVIHVYYILHNITHIYMHIIFTYILYIVYIHINTYYIYCMYITQIYIHIIHICVTYMYYTWMSSIFEQHCFHFLSISHSPSLKQMPDLVFQSSLYQGQNHDLSSWSDVPPAWDLDSEERAWRRKCFLPCVS